MRVETNAELQDRLSNVVLELTQTRSELRSLQARQRRAARLTTSLSIGGLLVFVCLIAIVPISTAQNPGQPSGTVTRLEAPVLIQDKNGKTIVEISDRPGLHGISVTSTNGETAFLGFDKEKNGVLQLFGPGHKLSTEASADGFKFFGSSQSVAFLGADSAGQGALQLKNSTGGVLVDVGAVDANTGFAQVYPKSGKSPFPIPNYLKGSK